MNIDTNDQVCTASLKLLSDYWSLRIIDALDESEHRFCDLQRAVDNLNPVTLTSRLKRLEDAGLIERREHTEDGCSVTYRLSPTGIDVMPVILAINTFAEKQRSLKTAQ